MLAYKLGRSTQGRELAVTHTGALAGENYVADAFLRDCGIARVETLSALIEGRPLLARVPARRESRPPREPAVTTTAGGAAMVVDPLASRGVDVAQPTEATYTRFAAAGIKVARSRLIDLTLAGARYEVMKAALDILTSAPEFDIVVVVVGSSARFIRNLPCSRSSTAPAATSRLRCSWSPKPRRHAPRSAAPVWRISTPPRRAPTQSPPYWRGVRRDLLPLSSSLSPACGERAGVRGSPKRRVRGLHPMPSLSSGPSPGAQSFAAASRTVLDDAAEEWTLTAPRRGKEARRHPHPERTRSLRAAQ